MRLLSALLIAMLCIATPASVFAQSGEIDRARGHFAQGAEYYTAGEYSKAIVEFISGHNLAPNAMFLYNISLCYERLDNVPDARAAARKARGFDGMPDAVTVRNEARIASFGSILEAREVADSIADDPVLGKKSPSESSGFGALGWTGAVIGVLGIAGLGFALILNQQVESDKRALADANGRNDFEEATRLTNEINDTRETGRIIFFTGIGLTVMGLALVTWELLDDPDETSVSLVPALGDDGAGVVLHGRF
jgi:tetratricopeptide (TPR) repeat protein